MELHAKNSDDERPALAPERRKDNRRQGERRDPKDRRNSDRRKNVQRKLLK